MLFLGGMSAGTKDVKAIRTQFLLRAVTGLYKLASDATAVDARLMNRAEALRQYLTWVKGELIPEQERLLKEVLENLLSGLPQRSGRSSISFREPVTSGREILLRTHERSSQADYPGSEGHQEDFS